jgi:hypothetical protein
MHSCRTGSLLTCLTLRCRIHLGCWPDAVSSSGPAKCHCRAVNASQNTASAISRIRRRFLSLLSPSLSLSLSVLVLALALVTAVFLRGRLEEPLISSSFKLDMWDGNAIYSSQGTRANLESPKSCTMLSCSMISSFTSFLRVLLYLSKIRLLRLGQ